MEQINRRCVLCPRSIYRAVQRHFLGENILQQPELAEYIQQQAMEQVSTNTIYRYI